MIWFKLFSEARNDAKLRTLSDSEFRTWFNLICLASEQETRGIISNYNEELLAIEVCNGDVTLLNVTIVTLKKLRIIDVTDENKIAFLKFEDRQNINPSDSKEKVRERVRKSRERKQGKASLEKPPEEIKNVTTCNDNVTTCNEAVTTIDKNRIEENREEKSTPKGVGTENAPPKKNHEFLHPEKIPNIDSPLAIEIRKICKKPIYLSENDREKMREALVILESQNATVEQMKDFGAKVQFHWCGRDRQTKQRCPPGIMQVAENWQAVLAIDTTRTTKSKKHTEAELDAMAAKYA